SFEHRTAYYADGYAGAVLCLPPGIEPDWHELSAVLERSIAARRQDELFAVIEQMQLHHPSEPHWYLPLLGVDPTRQRNGYGSAPLKSALRRCDRDKRLAYLEATSPASSALYERHGFEVVGTIQGGSSTILWPMMRRPH